MLSTAASVQAVNDDMKFHTSEINSQTIHQYCDSKCLGKCNHILAKPTLICRRKRLAIVDVKNKKPEEIGLEKSVFHSKETVSKVIKQNAGVAEQMAALISPQDPSCALKVNLNISLSHSPPNFNGQDQQLVDNVRRQLLVSQGEEAVDEVLNTLHFRYRTTLHVGVQIWKTQRNHRPDRYSKRFRRSLLQLSNVWGNNFCRDAFHKAK
ncbi:hypothetical protein ACTXT7_008430 [Hymenolepis weldensis]